MASRYRHIQISPLERTEGGTPVPQRLAIGRRINANDPSALTGRPRTCEAICGDPPPWRGVTTSRIGSFEQRAAITVRPPEQSYAAGSGGLARRAAVGRRPSANGLTRAA